MLREVYPSLAEGLSITHARFDSFCVTILRMGKANPMPFDLLIRFYGISSSNRLAPFIGFLTRNFFCTYQTRAATG